MSEINSLKLSLVGLDEDERKRVLEYAEVLKDSRTNAGFFSQYLHGACTSVFLVTDASDDDTWVAYSEDDVTLPLETLKVCPWMCAKYGVSVSAETEVCWADNEGGHECADMLINGVITKAEQDGNEWALEVSKAVQVQEDWDEEMHEVYGLDTVKINLDNLPKGITLCQK